MARTLFLFLIIIGASLVLLGALFKIQHWPFGQEILALGLMVELVAVLVVIFKGR